MIIPDKIRIGGQDISVVNTKSFEDNCLGSICVAESVLQIADKFNNKQQYDNNSNYITHLMGYGY